MKKFFLKILFFLIIANISKAEIIAVVDVSLLMSKSDAGKFIANKIQNENKKLSDNFKLKEQELVNEEKKLVSQKNVLDENEFNDKAKKLSQKINLYKKEKKENIEKLTQKKAKGIANLVKNLNIVLVDYSKANQVTLVVDKKYTIISKSENDITDEILKLLNEKIKKVEFN